MKKTFLTGLLLWGTLAAGSAGIYYQGPMDLGPNYFGTVQTQTIVDGNPANLTFNSMTLSGLNESLSSVTITLNISGGNNNGLYAYLVGPNNMSVTLMNQPGYALDGFGAIGAGMNITLQDSATDHGSIQSETSSSMLSGSYNAAGNLSGFNSLNPNGTWTLYFADTVAGGGNATLNGWMLDIEAVPEPVNVALGILGGMLAMLVFGKRLKLGLCR